jgi:hypothetical protein
MFLASTSSGRQMLYEVGDLNDFGTVWYNPEAFANIISITEDRRVRQIIMYSSQQPAFHVHKKEGTGTGAFKEHES